MDGRSALALLVLILAVLLLLYLQRRTKLPPQQGDTTSGRPLAGSQTDANTGDLPPRVAPRPGPVHRPFPPAKPARPAPEPKPKAKKQRLTGAARVAWQQEEWARQQKEKAEREQDARDAAKERRAEKDKWEQEEKRKAMAAAEGREAERQQKEAARLEAEGRSRAGHAAWREYIGRPIPPDIARDMRAYLAGQFVGEDRSPLAYVGYRVGRTNGLMLRERHRRLQVCFRIDIPGELRVAYASWGPPASSTRLEAMYRHLGMLADMRSTRPNFEQAVSEWNGDKAWLREEFSQIAQTFRQEWSKA